MSKLFRIFAVALAVLWLPLTAHCELETISANIHETLDDDCCAPSEGCADDACGLIEGKSIAPANSLLKAPVPELSVDQCLACVLAQLSVEESAPIIPDRDFIERPLAWTATWCFTRRAAPPVRAPAIIA